jgi:transposase
MRSFKNILNEANDFSDEQLSIIQRLRKRSSSYKRIQQAIPGTSESKISRAVKNHDLGPRPNIIHDEDAVKTFMDNHSKGASNHEHAKALGVSVRTVRNLRTHLVNTGQIERTPNQPHNKGSSKYTDPDTIAEFKRLKSIGHTNETAAKRLGLVTRYITGAVNKADGTGRKRVQMSPEHIDFAKNLRSRTHSYSLGNGISKKARYGAHAIARELNSKFPDANYEWHHIASKIRDGTI